MKVAITGHSKGIGKALADIFETNGHTVLGFSRSNGFDISESANRISILNKSQDADIFIKQITDCLKGYVGAGGNVSPGYLAFKPGFLEKIGLREIPAEDVPVDALF